jgi:hypothetical protein
VIEVGLVMALASLLTFDWMLPGGMIAGDASLAEARTGGFTVLVLAQLFNALCARSESTSALRGLFANRWLWGGNWPGRRPADRSGALAAAEHGVRYPCIDAEPVGILSCSGQLCVLVH